MRVLIASAEFSPLVRTGGLGDAVAGLCHALVRQGAEVDVVLPRYRHLAGLGEERPGAGPARALYALAEGDVRVFLVDDPPSFDREGIYGPVSGTAYEDEWERWGRFCLTVAQVAHGYDLLHLHDAHAGAASLISDVPTIYTVHNAAFPVTGPLEEARTLLGLGPAFSGVMGPLEWYGKANYLKAAIIGADQATTVSPGFARELERDPEVSSGLNDVIAHLPRPMVGIMNGIDTVKFDPSSDPVLPSTYGPDTLARRETARAVLLTETGLDARGMVFGMVGRVAGQKGFDLIDEVVDDLIEEGVRLVILGNGEMDDIVDRWEERHPKAVRHLPFDEALGRLVFAGSDAYLMPSRFEPGGLGNIYAMRYGSPPLVRFTGGLADTVVDVDEVPARGNGFGFRPYLAAELAKTVRRAMRYHGAFPDLWAAMQRRGMQEDWSWDRAARQYLQVYRSVLAPTPRSAAGP